MLSMQSKMDALIKAHLICRPRIPVSIIHLLGMAIDIDPKAQLLMSLSSIRDHHITIQFSDGVEAMFEFGHKGENMKNDNVWPEAKPVRIVRRRRLPPGECPSCDRDGKEGPSHDPSPHCESGSHPHCTCDLCF